MATGLAHIFSEDGLVVGADGFNYYRTAPGPEGLTLQSRRAQKIYHLPGADREVVCAFYGRVTLSNDADERVFSFIHAFRNAAKNIRFTPLQNAKEFADRICPLVLEELAAVKREGKLTRYPSPPRQPGETDRPIVRVFADGCFNGQMYRAGICFFHLDQQLGWRPLPHDLNRSHKSLFYGAERIKKLLFSLDESDSRLKKYQTPACRLMAERFRNPDLPIRLDDAIDAAKNFIAACSSKAAMEIEGDDYQRIGGKPQIAVITPGGGFYWDLRPKRFDPL
jgi:hypothetical protein